MSTQYRLEKKNMFSKSKKKQYSSGFFTFMAVMDKFAHFYGADDKIVLWIEFPPLREKKTKHIIDTLNGS